MVNPVFIKGVMVLDTCCCGRSSQRDAEAALVVEGVGQFDRIGLAILVHLEGRGGDRDVVLVLAADRPNRHRDAQGDGSGGCAACASAGDGVAELSAGSGRDRPAGRRAGCSAAKSVRWHRVFSSGYEMNRQAIMKLEPVEPNGRITRSAASVPD
jgi:hypothetical protein